MAGKKKSVEKRPTELVKAITATGGAIGNRYRILQAKPTVFTVIKQASRICCYWSWVGVASTLAGAKAIAEADARANGVTPFYA